MDSASGHEDAVISEFRLLRADHLKWYKTFRRNLTAWMGRASPLDWSKLEMQDPSGRLKKFNFEHVIHPLVE